MYTFFKFSEFYFKPNQKKQIVEFGHNFLH